MSDTNDTFYCIIEYAKIKIETIEAHIKELPTKSEALNFPNCDVVIIKTKLPSRNAVGTGFFLPNIYQYKILDKNENPFFLNYKRNKTTDYIIKTERSGYYNDVGQTKVSIKDKNDVLASIRISAGFDSKINIIKNLIVFMITFEENQCSEWNFYYENTDLKNHISELETEIKSLKFSLENSESENIELKNKTEISE